MQKELRKGEEKKLNCITAGNHSLGGNHKPKWTEEEEEKEDEEKNEEKGEEERSREETSHQQMTGDVFVRPIQYAEQENVQYLDRKVK